jgi:putative SOS response-associated peptidase YedK
MCFTIEIHLSRKAIEERFSANTSALYDFDFNYFYRAFSNPPIPVIDQQEPDQVKLSQWGLIPSWVSDRQKAEKIRKGTYNARIETLAEKPSFREPLRRGRCLVIAHGFFEWQLVNGVRVPWYIRLKSDAPFVFAGLCDQWKDSESDQLLHTCTIITTVANPLLAKIHNTRKRMPVILPPEDEQQWIARDVPPADALQMLLPLDQNKLQAHTVSPMIAAPDARPDDPDLISPYTYSIPDSLF